MITIPSQKNLKLSLKACMRMKVLEPNLQLPQQFNNGTALKVKLLLLLKLSFPLGILDLTRKLSSTKLTLKIVVWKSQLVVKKHKKRIEFKKVEDKGYGKEGYGITIKDGVITVEAATNTGAFYATRTLLQMGENDCKTEKSVITQALAIVALC